MAINFPLSPTNGQVFTPGNGVTYTYQMPPGRWSDVGLVGPVGPVGPAGGDLAGEYPNPTVSPEAIDDRVASLLVPGTNITLTYDDTANSLTVASSAAVTPEVIDDRVAALLVAGANVNLTYDDVGNSLTIASTASGGTGTVTSTSVVNANGLAGTVATATTTPAITLSTTITGMLRGDGTAISAGTAGTDYVAPAALSAYEPVISSGTTAQYWRGDKSWQTLPTGGGGGIAEAPVDSNTYGRKDAAWAEIVDISSGTYQNYTFNATTAAPPAAGTVRFNNATQTAVTTIWFHFATADVNSVNLETYWVQRVRAGDHFYFQDKDDPTKWQLYQLNSAYTDSGNYATMAVTWMAGGSALTAGRIIVTREGGTAGSFQPLDATLTALAALDSTAGLVEQTGADAFTKRALGTGVATFLSTPTTANLAAAVTGETGTGALVFATNPTFVSPQLGAAIATTPSGAAISTEVITASWARTWICSNKITIASSAPSTPSTNDLWVDTT